MDQAADLSVTQAARKLGVFPSTVVRWINGGLFPGAYKLNPEAANSPYRIPPDTLATFLKKRDTTIAILDHFP